MIIIMQEFSGLVLYLITRPIIFVMEFVRVVFSPFGILAVSHSVSFLFAVYIDELSLCLHSVNVGCKLSNMIVNHLLLADDAVVYLLFLPKVSNSC